LKTALITIGSTREYIDPVRYISNESSGKQGMSLIRGITKKKL
jgi:phosphopantothenoylcysteine decarboxylase/phosphopantothenate--cysteine ligase